MPSSRNTARPQRSIKRHPYGVGNGTRAPRGTLSNAPDTNERDVGENDEQQNGQDANEQGDGERGGEAYDTRFDGVQADQVINVLPDQPIKLVITSSEPPVEAKKGHPQERITKFWSNFEPEYLGGITQILPDAVSEVAAATKPPKPAPKESPVVIRSYENAKASCIKSVKRIIRECRANNRKYTDPHFDLERDLKVTEARDCLYGLTSWDDEKNPGDVKRVTDIFEHPQFYKDGAGSDDIMQGALGDCWFLAALSAITSNQDMLRKVCVIQDQDVGVYGFVFHRDGEWHPCIIDDKLYMRAPSFDESGETILEQYGVRQKDQEKLYIETLQKGSKALYFASCRDENETWVPLFEKAFAKAHGDFSALDGGHVGEALEDLTGGVTTEIYTTNILSKEDHWRDLRRIGKDFIFSCNVSVFSDWRGVSDDNEKSAIDSRRKGIMDLHAYSVLDTYEGYGERLVKIRNPWGEVEWTGAWSDGSKEWTPEWLQRLEHKFGDDGVFWMSFEDMLRRYKAMDRTRILGPEWYIAQEWTNVQVPWNSRDYQETTFCLDVPEDTDTIIVLSQLDSRYFKGLEGRYFYRVSFRVQKHSEDEDEDEDDYIARSPVNYELRRSANVEVHLEKGKYTVLFKIEALKTDRPEIEEVIRDNIDRREKITQMATLYDLAYRKGKPKVVKKKEEPKPEPKEETKPTEPAATSAPASSEENKTPQPDAKEEEDPKTTEEKVEESSEQKTEEASEAKATTEGETSSEAPKNESQDSQPADKQTELQSSPESKPPAPAPVPAPEPESEEPTQSGPDEKDPNRNPWNASCVVGLRVFSKLAELKVKVLLPGDKPDGVTLDRDDIAMGPLEEAEKAQENEQAAAEDKE